MYLKWKADGKIKQQDLSIEALVLTYLYPRIDVNVSTGINHLLKSPWCVHPKTGKLTSLTPTFYRANDDSFTVE